ncbi:MAG: hypothetical protein A3A57_00660 [Candidatus Woykebacteria bacterium RIFCSPLOWO2_01_FULL_41_12]|uniref:GIY-YIG domain-containing protein n=1 Tax=Candidatus Woykebacteria bacterium RIFCSPLOWO2_01_FULL_41_12 TaxID=1802604 RepID=A0A1G1X027_9BACT|nr:MAG: hypothetical protein A3A57_00660 [Candidatus Woykebacteria bacterium RIFCSPLOWO2_01_FULL_41_12]
MYYVYVLRSRKNGKLYTGFSRNLKTRLDAHLGKRVYSTRRMENLELVFYEAFKVGKDAQRREKYLKTTKGKRALKLMLKDSLGALV